MTMTQPTSDSKSPPDVASCLSPEDLRQYLNGWYDDDDAARIESHLTTCTGCETALRELEVKPDTLLQSLQSTTVEKTPEDDNAISESAEQPIDAALAKARKLMDVPAESAKSTWQPASRELGVYELLRPLGRGGMGAVYLANHRQLHKQVAIKLLPVMSAEDSDVRARFKREIRVVGKLNHPSIVAATDAGEIDGTQFLVMEYVPGLDLSRLARLLGKLPVADACELMRQVALGLSCAHAEGVVHRDVKPSNLMLDEAGHIRILDFGLAQLSYWDEASIELTSVGQLMGTLDYMAPEQAELCGGVDYRADLYAMGATLFRLLCGRPPLAAAPNQSPLEKLRLLANHQPPKLDTLCPEAPPELVRLVASLLARSPQDRPASAAHVAEELAAFTESANLVTLLKRAQEKEAQSPQDKKLLNPFVAAGRKPSGEAAPDGSRRSANKGNHHDAGRGRIRRWIIGATLLPLLAVAGVFIKLETDKGQLVIESAVADVKVRIINDGKPVTELTIKHGTTATRLRAGKYEVVIDGSSDGLTIENDQFTLKNGDTIVARIWRGNGSVADSANAVAKDDKPSNEPLYEGKSLSEWLDVMERDRSTEAIAESLRACDAMFSDSNGARIGEKILKVLPQIPGDHPIHGTKSYANTHSDTLGFSLLARAFPTTFYSIWLREYEGGTEEWRDRLLRHASFGSNSEFIGSNVTPDIQLFVEWAKKRMMEPPLAGSEELKQTMTLANTLTSGWPLAQQKDFIDTLKRSPNLDVHWWLMPMGQPFSFGPHPSTPISQPRSQVAMKVLLDDSSNDVVVAEACMTLASFPNTTDVPGRLSYEFKSELLPAVEKRLSEILQRSPVVLDHTLNVDGKFSQWISPSVDRPRVILSAVYTQQGMSCPASVLCELLDLYVNVSPSSHKSEALRKLAELVSKVIPKLKLSGNRLDQKLGSVGVQWPQLNLCSIVPNNETTPAEISAAIWGEDYKPTHQDGFKLILLQHPALKPYLQQTDTTTDPAMAANSANVTLPKPALYEGKTLDEWLEMLSREHSPAGLKSAFDACSALVSPETSDRITRTILKVVPGLDGELNLTPGRESQATTVDDRAMRVLWKANQGSAFYKLWVREFEGGDENWRKRLWNYAHYYQRDAETMEPIVAWAEVRLCQAPTGIPGKDADTLTAADYLRDLTSSQRDTFRKEFINRILTALKQSPHLDTTYWLSQPLAYRSEDLRSRTTVESNRWPTPFEAEITRVAIETLDDDHARLSFVARASMILAHGAELDAEQKARVLVAVDRRIRVLCANPEMLKEVTSMDAAFGSFSTPEITWPQLVTDGRNGTYLVLQLLDIVKHIDDAESVQPSLGFLSAQTNTTKKMILDLDATTSDGSIFGGRQKTLRGSLSNFPLRLNWPELTYSASSPISNPDVAFHVAKVWGQHQPTAQDWLMYYILEHPVMQEYLKPKEGTNDKATSDNGKPAAAETSTEKADILSTAD